MTSVESCVKTFCGRVLGLAGYQAHFFMYKRCYWNLRKKWPALSKANGLFGSADKILLAVSGGADSTALMYAVCAIKAENILSGDILCAI